MQKAVGKLICDTCGQPINKVEDGYVEWQSTAHEQWGYKVIHNYESSPLVNTNQRCVYYPNDDLKSDTPLSDFFGVEKQQTLESLDLSSSDELLDFILRIGMLDS